METAYAIEHISKLGNVVVRAGCGEFDGERNVCRRRTRPLLRVIEAYLETCIFYAPRGDLVRARRSGNGREKNLKQAKQASKDALAPWRAVVPAADSHSYNKHIQSLKELTRAPTSASEPQSTTEASTRRVSPPEWPRQTPRQGS